jgi:hypothetical protein
MLPTTITPTANVEGLVSILLLLGFVPFHLLLVVGTPISRWDGCQATIGDPS